jgi:hypothetical protein
MLASTILIAYNFYLTLANPVQYPIQPDFTRRLHGRSVVSSSYPHTVSTDSTFSFLHITDIHPDPFYRKGSSISSSCHSRQPKSELPRAGLYGTPWVYASSSE